MNVSVPVEQPIGSYERVVAPPVPLIVMKPFAAPVTEVIVSGSPVSPGPPLSLALMSMAVAPPRRTVNPSLPAIGGSLTPLTVIENDWSALVSTPPLAVPPLSSGEPSGSRSRSCSPRA